jgi:membrane-bound lytic murein transglycosylase D
MRRLSHALRALVATSALAASAVAAPSPSVLPTKAAPSARPVASARKPAAPPTRGAKPGAKGQGPASSTAPAKGRAASQDPVTRHLVSGAPTADDAANGADTPELRALREAERELFPPAAPIPGDLWPSELPAPLSAPEDAPRVHASGLPPSPPPSAPPVAEGGRDLAWLARLQMPDLPVRWDARVVRYLEFFKDDPRGRQILTTWTRRSGRYRDAVRRVLRRKGLPEDLLALSMIESGFDPTARSAVGAMGLWQFMTDTAKAYGLPVDRWADQRLNAEASTEAAADFLGDLHRRFGTWELAIAAYNMGYWGVAGSIRKYNTNDFWVLSRLEAALPWETTLYVPKILAAAIALRNPQAFGLTDVAVDAPLEGEPVLVPPGTSLASVAQAAGCTTREVEALNLELRASRTPPAGGDYPVVVPQGRGALATANLAKLRKGEPPLERYVVRFGESIEQIAAARGVTLAKLVELNAIAPGEVVRGGTVLLVPSLPPNAAPATTTSAQVATNISTRTTDDRAAIAVVPADIFVYPDRRRVFYRVLVGDTVREIADTFHVTIDELRRWNDLDPSARLQEGMTLQLFVPADADLAKTVVLGENDVRILPVGSDEFFAYWESLKGRKRITVTAREGETLAQIGARYGLTPGLIERINHRNRGEKLHDGDVIVVYVAESRAGSGVAQQVPMADPMVPSPNGPLPEAPMPDALPPLP